MLALISRLIEGTSTRVGVVIVHKYQRSESHKVGFGFRVWVEKFIVLPGCLEARGGTGPEPKPSTPSKAAQSLIWGFPKIGGP